jgi:hypothetical protein
VFLAAVIVVALIGLLFVSGIGEALALALLIVGAAFLVVGFVMSLINRWGTLMERLRSGNYPWYAAFGLGAPAWPARDTLDRPIPSRLHTGPVGSRSDRRRSSTPAMVPPGCAR